MNTVIRTVAAVAALSVTGMASAGEPAANTLSWDCARAGAPGLGAVKELFETSSNHYASQLRARLQARLRAECQRGAERILVVLARPSSSEDLRVAAVPTETAAATAARLAE